jgi:putative transposase
MRRIDKPHTGKTYHVYTKSIYGYVIFPSEAEYTRMYNMLIYYQSIPKTAYSHFLRSPAYLKNASQAAANPVHFSKGLPLVAVQAYCLMPTHIHLIIRQETDNGIRDYMSRVLNGFSKFFNKRHNRQGPLWQSRFGCALIRGPDHLQEKIAYVLNNPVKDLGIQRPEDWPYSSLKKTPPQPRGLGRLKVQDNRHAVVSRIHAVVDEPDVVGPAIRHRKRRR